MHDPMSVAFEIRRPWPRRVNWSTRKWYWPALITVWHLDPETDGTDNSCGWPTNRWRRFHVHHWRVQVHPWLELRRRLFTRCEYCGEPFTKSDKGPNPISLNVMWGKPQALKRRWLQGERFLFHHDCTTEFRQRDLQRARSIVEHDDRRKGAFGYDKESRSVVDERNAAKPDTGSSEDRQHENPCHEPTQLCGHPVSAVVSSDDGTAYCAACKKAVAKLREVTDA